MATLAGQRAQFTWSLNQYNLAEDAETRTKFAKRMAKYIAAAPANGFTVDEVTQDQIYPASEVEQYIGSAGADEDPGIPKNKRSGPSKKRWTRRMWSAGAMAEVSSMSMDIADAGTASRSGRPRRTRCSVLPRRSARAPRINRFCCSRSRPANAVPLNGRSRRPWRREAAKSRVAGPNGLKRRGMRFWRSMNSLRTPAVRQTGGDY